MDLPAGPTQGFTFGGRHRPQTPPPDDGIPLHVAEQQYGLSRKRAWKLIEAGELSAGTGRSSSGNRCVMVSRSMVEKFKAGPSKGDLPPCSFGPEPPDGERVQVLAAELSIAYDTIRFWCGWNPHPALGRPIRSGIGDWVIPVSDGRRRRWRGLLVSRADVTKCADAYRHPLNRRFNGSPGTWIAEGIFRHDDGSLYFTDRYVYENEASFGMKNLTLGSPVYRRRLKTLKVTWPGGHKSGRWSALVHSEASLEQLVGRRAGKVEGGMWLVRGEIWKDGEGLWYSSKYIAATKSLPAKSIHRLLEMVGAEARHQYVPIGSKRGGRSAKVFHEEQVDPLLGIDLPQATPAANAPTTGVAQERPKGKVGRPKDPKTAEVYAFCYESRAARKKLLVILREAAIRFGPEAPKDIAAVSKYIKRHSERNGLPLPG